MIIRTDCWPRTRIHFPLCFDIFMRPAIILSILLDATHAEHVKLHFLTYIAFSSIYHQSDPHYPYSGDSRLTLTIPPRCPDYSRCCHLIKSFGIVNPRLFPRHHQLLSTRSNWILTCGVDSGRITTFTSTIYFSFSVASWTTLKTKLPVNLPIDVML